MLKCIDIGIHVVNLLKSWERFVGKTYNLRKYAKIILLMSSVSLLFFWKGQERKVMKISHHLSWI